MAAPGPLAVEAIGISKSFGALTALEDVSLSLPPASFHALLGENGAGKSTLVKCIMGALRPDQGAIVIGGRERDIASPREAHAFGLGMVYQHFTLVPNMTVLENFVLARDRLPVWINWRRERLWIEALLADLPFRVELDRPVRMLAAGEKQKVEILKQLALGRSILILDEPTSVLTPDEADEVLGFLRGRVTAGALSVLMVTHKFREVMAFADRVSVLRHGRVAGAGPVAGLDPALLAEWMTGTGAPPLPGRRTRATPGTVALEINDLTVENDRGAIAVRALSLQARTGEIVGIAGVSGNGQKELVEALSGRRRARRGHVLVHGRPYRARRAEMRRHRIGCLPEEPLRSAAVPAMSLAENLALRRFDEPEFTLARLFVRRAAMRRAAIELIRRFRIKASSPRVAIATLSGGNVQRAVLARELSAAPDLLIVANPCFGLDFAAAADIRAQLLATRERGAAILLLSEDLDELFELSDRLLVMQGGRIVHAADPASTSRAAIGRHMAGHAAVPECPPQRHSA